MTDLRLWQGELSSAATLFGRLARPDSHRLSSQPTTEPFGLALGKWRALYAPRGSSCPWTFEIVLSIRTYSKSGVAAKAWKSLSHTLPCDQRRNRAWTAGPFAERVRPVTPARGLPGALSDQCGTPRGAMLAAADEPQIESQAR